MFKFKGVHHVAISVPSLSAAKLFYVDALGMSIVDEGEIGKSDIVDKVTGLVEAQSQILMVNAGNIFLEIFEFSSPVAVPQDNRAVCDHGYTHLAFEVEDIELAYTSLRKAGVIWHHPPVEAGEGYIMTYGRDPFGNVIEIQEITSNTEFNYDKLKV